mgnify:CR=1 FL=1
MTGLQFHFFLKDAQNESQMHEVIAYEEEILTQVDNHHLDLTNE